MNLTFNKAGFKKVAKEKPYENSNTTKKTKSTKDHKSDSHNSEISNLEEHFDIKIETTPHMNDIKKAKAKKDAQYSENNSNASTNIKSKSDITTPNKQHLIASKIPEASDLNSQRINNVSFCKTINFVDSSKRESYKWERILFVKM